MRRASSRSSPISAAGIRSPKGFPGAGAAGGEPSWGRWFRQVDSRVHRGVTVMSGDRGDPLLVLDRVGQGRVAQLLSDQMWFWARGFEGGGPQAELLRRLAYWLMKEPDLEENDLRATVEGDRLDRHPAIARTGRPAGHRDGARRRQPQPDLDAGERRAQHRQPADQRDGALPGERRHPHRARRGGPAQPDRICGRHHDTRKAGPDRRRDRRRQSSGWAPAAMPEIRRVSADRAAAGRNWMGFRANGDYTVTGFSETPLLPGIAALLLVVGGLIAAWRREGR